MPHVNVISVGCPLCRVGAGHACLEDKTGRPVKPHQDRIRHALAVSRYPKPDFHLIED